MTVAMTGVLAIVIVTSVAVSSLGILYAARTQAQNAADAAALAAAVATYPPAAGGSPVAVARQVVAANHASLVECSCPRDGALRIRTVEVVSAVDVSVPLFGVITVRGSSRAEFDPRQWLGR